MAEHIYGWKSTRDRQSSIEAPADLQAHEGIHIAGKTYLTAPTLAEILGVTPRTLARWDEARIGPPKIKIGRLVVYDADKIPEWMARHENQPVRLAARENRK